MVHFFKVVSVREIKIWTANQRHIRLFLNQSRAISATVSESGNEITASPADVRGIPNQVRLDEGMLGQFLEDTYVIVNKCSDGTVTLSINQRIHGGGLCLSVSISDERIPVLEAAANQLDIDFYQNRNCLTLDESEKFQALKQRETSLTADEKQSFQMLKKFMIPTERLKKLSRDDQQAILIKAIMSQEDRDHLAFVQFMLGQTGLKVWKPTSNGTFLIRLAVDSGQQAVFEELLNRTMTRLTGEPQEYREIGGVSCDLDKVGLLKKPRAHQRFFEPPYFSVVSALASAIILNNTPIILALDRARARMFPDPYALNTQGYFTLSIASRNLECIYNLDIERTRIDFPVKFEEIQIRKRGAMMGLAPNQMLASRTLYFCQYGDSANARVMFMAVDYISKFIIGDDDCTKMMQEKVKPYLDFLVGRKTSGGLGLSLSEQIDISRAHVYEWTEVAAGDGVHARWVERRSMVQKLTISVFDRVLLPECVIENALLQYYLVPFGTRDNFSYADSMRERQSSEWEIFTRNKLHLLELFLAIEPSRICKETETKLLNYFLGFMPRLESADYHYMNDYRRNSIVSETILQLRDWIWKAREWDLQKVADMMERIVQKGTDQKTIFNTIQIFANKPRETIEFVGPLLL